MHWLYLPLQICIAPPNAFHSPDHYSSPLHESDSFCDVLCFVVSSGKASHAYLDPFIAMH